MAMTGLWRRAEPLLWGLVAVIGFLVFWEGLSAGWWATLAQPILGDSAQALRVRPIFVSAPSRVWTRLLQMAASGELREHLAASGIAFGLGGVIALLVGIPLGLAVGWYRRLGHAIEPFLTAYNATPQVVFIPLLIIWVGTGTMTKVLIIAMVTFIPLTMSAIAAARTVDARLLRVARSFGSSEWQRLRDIVLPTSVPYLLAGLRLGVGRAMVGIVVGEIYGSSAGIGFMINAAGSAFQTDRVFVGIFVIAAVGLLLTGAIHLLERRFESWRPQATSR